MVPFSLIRIKMRARIHTFDLAWFFFCYFCCVTRFFSNYFNWMGKRSFLPSFIHLLCVCDLIVCVPVFGVKDIEVFTLVLLFTLSLSISFHITYSSYHWFGSSRHFTFQWNWYVSWILHCTFLNESITRCRGELLSVLRIIKVKEAREKKSQTHTTSLTVFYKFCYSDIFLLFVQCYLNCLAAALHCTVRTHVFTVRYVQHKIIILLLFFIVHCILYN